MPNREKVIKAIELEIKYDNIWECKNECPYYGITDRHCFTQALMDALELLKEQEAVKPKYDKDAPYVCEEFRCGVCDQFIRYKQPYCCNCGRMVKWNDSDRNGNG